MRALVILGQKFNSLSGFYKNIESYLIEKECPWGQNLDSLDEITARNFNYSDNKEKDVTCIIIWTDFQKSNTEIKL